MPCGVPKTRSKCSGNPACGRNEKMPPPSLLTTTKTASTPSRPARRRPFWSWSIERSPASAAVGPPPPASATRGRPRLGGGPRLGGDGGGPFPPPPLGIEPGREPHGRVPAGHHLRQVG